METINQNDDEESDDFPPDDIEVVINFLFFVCSAIYGLLTDAAEPELIGTQNAKNNQTSKVENSPTQAQSKLESSTTASKNEQNLKIGTISGDGNITTQNQMNTDDLVNEPDKVQEVGFESSSEDDQLTNQDIDMTEKAQRVQTTNVRDIKGDRNVVNTAQSQSFTFNIREKISAKCLQAKLRVARNKFETLSKSFVEMSQKIFSLESKVGKISEDEMESLLQAKAELNEIQLKKDSSKTEVDLLEKQLEENQNIIDDTEVSKSEPTNEVGSGVDSTISTTQDEDQLNQSSSHVTETKQIESYTKLEQEYHRLKDEILEKIVIQSNRWSQRKSLLMSFENEEVARDEFKKFLDAEINLPSIEEKLVEIIENLEDPDFAFRFFDVFIEGLNSAIEEWSQAKQPQNIGEQKIANYKTHLKMEMHKLADDVRKKNLTDDDDQICEAFQLWFQKKMSNAEEITDKDNFTAIDTFDEVKAKTFSVLKEKLQLIKGKGKPDSQVNTVIRGIKEGNKSKFENHILTVKASKHIKKTNLMSKVVQYTVGEPYEYEKNQKVSKWKRSEKIILNLLEDETSNISDCFNPKEIIEQVLSKVREETKNDEESPCHFTSGFQWDALVTFYGYSVKVIAGRFDEYNSNRNKPSDVIHLEEIKESLHRGFVNDCKAVNTNLRKAEVFAELILIDAIVIHIKVSKGKEIYDHLKRTRELSSKSETTFKMLQDLLNADTESIIDFLVDYKTFAEKWISVRALKCCQKNNYLQDWLKKQIDRCVETLTVKLTTSKNMTQQTQMMLGTTWFQYFVSKLLDEQDDSDKIELEEYNEFYLKMIGAEVDITCFVDETVRLINETEFKDLIYQTILEKSLDSSTDDQLIQVLKWFEFNPLERLHDRLLGCTDQCPICGAICEGGIVACKNQRKKTHFTKFHLPRGIVGHGQFSSQICSSEICSKKNTFKLLPKQATRFGVSHKKAIPYKDANKIFKEIWSIEPDPNSEANQFWKFLFVKHQKRIAEIHGHEEADDIPDSWNEITREKALENLKEFI